MTEVKIAAHPWLQKLPCLDWWLKIAACPWLQKLPFLDWRLCIATTLVQLEYCYPPKSTKKVDFSGGITSIYLTMCLSVYLSIYLPIYLSILSYPIQSIDLSIYTSYNLSIFGWSFGCLKPAAETRHVAARMALSSGSTGGSPQQKGTHLAGIVPGDPWFVRGYHRCLFPLVGWLIEGSEGLPLKNNR